MNIESIREEWGGTVSNYVKGLTLSFLFTIASFGLVIFEVFPNRILAITITGFALIQAAVQLIFFLHVGHEKEPRWRIHFFYCMMGVLAIIAAGTIWIMYDLNARVMEM